MGRLTEENCKEETGYTFNDIFSLTGIYGVHPSIDLKANRPKYYYGDIDDKKIVIYFETDLIKEMHVRIDLVTKVINNVLFISKTEGKGIGFKRLCNQVEAAQRLGFRYIQLHAWGGVDNKDEEPINSIGHIIWGKYGFLMYDKTEESSFLDLVKKHKREDKMLFEMVNNDPGLKIWEKEGFDWRGKFYVEGDSLSLKILNIVRERKGVPIMQA